MLLAPTLSISAGSGAAIVRPTFSRDFAGEKTLDNGTGPAITFTRASGATFFDANGDLQTAGNNVPRFDHDPASGNASRGLLIEEARTNSLPNSQMSGVVAGSPGTPPTGWGMNTTSNGLSRSSIATSTINGMTCIDVRITGTATATFGFGLDPQATTAGYAASSGQTWSGLSYFALVAGTAPTNFQISIAERSSANTALAGTTINLPALSATLSRHLVTRTLSNASTAKVTMDIRGAATNGEVVDFTLRIAAPQLELGAFPTSYIPTTTAAATRSADSAVVTPIDSFYNQAEGSVVVEIQRLATALSSFTGAVSFSTDADSTGNEIYLSQARSPSNVDTVAFLSAVATGQTTRDSTTSVSLVMGQVTALCAAIKSSEFFVGGRSGAGSFVSATNTNAHALIAATKLRLGQRANGGTFLNGHIRKLAYYPKRLSNTLLQQLTT